MHFLGFIHYKIFILMLVCGVFSLHPGYAAQHHSGVTNASGVVQATQVDSESELKLLLQTRFFFKSVEEIDNYFQQKHNRTHLPELDQREYYANAFAFKIKSWLSFYIDMHKNTGERKWIEYARKTIDFMFSHTDNNLFKAGKLTGLPYYQAPLAVLHSVPQTGHIGWSTKHKKGRKVEVLEDGVTCKYIMKVADYIIANNIDFSAAKVNQWMDNCSAIIKSHDSEFVFNRFAGNAAKAQVDGSYYYTNPEHPRSLWSNPLAFNHSANIACAMFLLNKYRPEPAFTAKQQAIADFMMRNFTAVNNHFVWPYGVNVNGQPLTGVLQDVNHSVYDVDFLVDMYSRGYINSAFMQRLLSTVPVFLTTTSSAHFIDGRGQDDGGDRVAMYEGYLSVAKQLDPQIYQLIMINLINYLDKSRSNLWHAQMAAAARIAYLLEMQ